jgi:hypothetical protein
VEARLEWDPSAEPPSAAARTGAGAAASLGTEAAANSAEDERSNAEQLRETVLEETEPEGREYIGYLLDQVFQNVTSPGTQLLLVESLRANHQGESDQRQAQGSNRTARSANIATGSGRRNTENVGSAWGSVPSAHHPALAATTRGDERRVADPAPAATTQGDERGAVDSAPAATILPAGGRTLPDPAGDPATTDGPGRTGRRESTGSEASRVAEYRTQPPVIESSSSGGSTDEALAALDVTAIPRPQGIPGGAWAGTGTRPRPEPLRPIQSGNEAPARRPTIGEIGGRLVPATADRPSGPVVVREDQQSLLQQWGLPAVEETVRNFTERMSRLGLGDASQRTNEQAAAAAPARARPDESEPPPTYEEAAGAAAASPWIASGPGNRPQRGPVDLRRRGAAAESTRLERTRVERTLAQTESRVAQLAREAERLSEARRRQPAEPPTRQPRQLPGT